MQWSLLIIAGDLFDTLIRPLKLLIYFIKRLKKTNYNGKRPVIAL
jgi:DNA repair exonuclease SbcCD nuclease subunit